MKRSAFYYALFLVVGFYLGSVAFLLTENYLDLKFEPRFSLGDIISATTVILVAILVAKYLEKHTDQDKTEKDMLLELLNNTLQVVQEFELSIESGKLTQIIASVTRLSKASSSFNKLLVDLQYPKDVLTETNCDDLIRDARKLSTETPIRDIKNHAKRTKCTTVVREGIISLATERKNLLDQKIDELKSKIVRSKILINKT